MSRRGALQAGFDAEDAAHPRGSDPAWDAGLEQRHKLRVALLFEADCEDEEEEGEEQVSTEASSHTLRRRRESLE